MLCLVAQATKQLSQMSFQEFKKNSYSLLTPYKFASSLYDDRSLLFQLVPQWLTEVVGQSIVQILSLKVVLPPVPKERVQPAETHKENQVSSLGSSKLAIHHSRRVRISTPETLLSIDTTESSGNTRRSALLAQFYLDSYISTPKETKNYHRKIASHLWLYSTCTIHRYT